MLRPLSLPLEPGVFALKVGDLVRDVAALLNPVPPEPPRLVGLFKRSVVTDDFGSQVDVRPRSEVEPLTPEDLDLVHRAWSHLPHGKDWSHITKTDYYTVYGPALDEAAQHRGWVSSPDLPDKAFVARISRVIDVKRLLEEVCDAATVGRLTLLDDSRLPLTVVSGHRVEGAYMPVPEAGRWLEGKGIVFEVKAASATPAAEAVPARKHGLRKRNALINDFGRIWPSVERDLRDASGNGLSEAASRHLQHGMWDADQALAWARERGKLIESRSSTGPAWAPL